MTLLCKSLPHLLASGAQEEGEEEEEEVVVVVVVVEEEEEDEGAVEVGDPHLMIPSELHALI